MKGSAFRSTLAAIERLHGAGGVAAVLGALDEESRDTLEHALGVSWYPVSLASALHEAVQRVLGFGSCEVSRRLGQEAARIDYNGVCRVVLRTVQYDSVFSRLELIWRHYYSEGTFAWEHRRPGASRLVIGDVRGFNEGMWHSCAGRAEELLRTTGLRSPEVAVVHTNDRGCTFDATWVP